MCHENGALKLESLGGGNPEAHFKTLINLNNTGKSECCRVY